MSIKWIPLLLLAGFLTAHAQEKNSLIKIQDAREAGKISYEQSLRLKHQFLYHYEDLPDEFRSSTPVKCAFGAANELRLASLKSPLLKPKTLLSQNMYVHSFISKGQTKRFHIYYDTTGVDAVPALDVNGNGLKDWVEETAAAMERAYRIEVDTLGYREPLDFGIYGFFKVFINNQYGAYGSTTPDSQVTSNPWTYTSYIEIDNDFIGNFATHGYDAIRVTCAHEFHHAVQLAYQNTYSDGDGWFYESTSTWMEEVVWDAVNDYYAYLDNFLLNPHVSLTAMNGAHEYGAVLWNLYLEKNFTPTMVRRAWELLPQNRSWNALQLALNASPYNSSLPANVTEMHLWNFFTAERADSLMYYTEGYNYPNVRFKYTGWLRDTSFTDSLPSLAARYYSLIVLDTTNVLMNFSSRESVSYFSVFTIEYNRSRNKAIISKRDAPVNFAAENLEPGDSLIVIVINKDYTTSNITNKKYMRYTIGLQPTNQPVNQPVLSDFKIYPQPFVCTGSDQPLKIAFRLHEIRDIRLDIFTSGGKRVHTLKNTSLSPGVYEGSNAFTWDGKDKEGSMVPSGVYFYTFTAGKYQKTGKLALIRK